MPERRRPSLGRFRRSCAALLAGVVAAGAAGPVARADDRGLATAVVTAQLRLLDQQRALNKCLAASPTRNTPCIRRAARRLAAVAGRNITAIRDATDGDELACVRRVAAQELSQEGLWRRAGLALARNQRKRARTLITQAAKIVQEQARIQPRCFADVLTAP